MKLRRDLNSLPKRSASETWAKIVGLISRDGSKHVEDLKTVSGVMASIITDEFPSQSPFILSGVGPRVVIYCRFNADAMTEDDNMDRLVENPTAGEWQLQVPCDEENLSWVKAALAKKSKRITAYDLSDPTNAEGNGAGRASSAIEIDWSVGVKP